MSSPNSFELVPGGSCGSFSVVQHEFGIRTGIYSQTLEIMCANGCMEGPEQWEALRKEAGNLALQGMYVRVTSLVDPPDDHTMENRVERLGAAINHVQSEGENPLVVAHSMGWLTSLLLAEKEGADAFRGVVAVSPVGHVLRGKRKVSPISIMDMMRIEAGASESGDGRTPSWQDGTISAVAFVRDLLPHIRGDPRGLLRQVSYALTVDMTPQAARLSRTYGERMQVHPCRYDPFAPAEITYGRLRDEGFKGGIDIIDAAHTDPFRRRRSMSRIMQSILKVHRLTSGGNAKHPGRRIFPLLFPRRWGRAT